VEVEVKHEVVKQAVEQQAEVEVKFEHERQTVEVPIVEQQTHERL
jgi:hypothetical protein